MGGAAGIAFVVFTVAGGVLQGDVPVYSDEPSVIEEWFAVNSGRYLVGGYLVLLGALCFIVFLAALVTTLARADDTHGAWSWLVLTTGLLVVVPPLVLIGFDPPLALLEGNVSDELARSLGRRGRGVDVPRGTAALADGPAEDARAEGGGGHDRIPR